MSDRWMRQEEIERMVDEAANHIKELKAAASSEYDIKVISTCEFDLREMTVHLNELATMLEAFKK